MPPNPVIHIFGLFEDSPFMTIEIRCEDCWALVASREVDAQVYQREGLPTAAGTADALKFKEHVCAG